MPFYQTQDDHFIANPATRGPWHVDFQHAGPPSALLARALEQQAEGLQIVRLCVDLLKPVPIDRLRIACEERTPGKRRRLVEASLFALDSGQLLARAQALMLRQHSVVLPVLSQHDPQPPLAVNACAPLDFGFFGADEGYHTAMELRLAAGALGQGRAQVWMRQRLPLVDQETPSPLQRLMCIADSGNGVSAALDTREYSFMNPDLSVNLRRPARGEWLCLDAHSHFQPHGLGMAESRIWDGDGVVANATQNLLLEAR